MEEKRVYCCLARKIPGPTYFFRIEKVRKRFGHHKRAIFMKNHLSNHLPSLIFMKNHLESVRNRSERSQVILFEV